MKKLKKFFKILLITLLILIGLLFATPYIFKSQIVSLVKKEVNKNLNASVDFKDVDISFFRNFPRVSIGLDDLQVIGKDQFAADTLLSAKRLDATVDIMSFIRQKNMNIYNIFLESPRINALVNEDGFSNWDIVKKKTGSSSIDSTEKPFKLKLDYYSIENGYVNYMDVPGNMSVVLENLNHSGTGDFTSELFTLRTKSAADAISFNYGALPYLSKVRSTVNTDIRIDNKNGTYSFDDIELFLNELKVNGKGVIKKLDNGYNLDVSFKTASADFKSLLSLVTPIYQKEFSKIMATGTAVVDGYVKGVYADSMMPGYHLAMEVKDGSFKYTDLPKAVEQINFKAVFDNTDGQPDNMIVDVSNGHLEVDKEPFDFRLLLIKPVSDMYVDAAARGKLNLSQLANYIKLEKGTSISGIMDADVNVKGNVKEIEQQRYNNFYSEGTIMLDGFNYTSVEYPTGIKVNKLHSFFTPTKIDLSDLDGQYMGTNFTGGGQINNLLSYLLNGKPLRADLNINADQLNLNDWIGVPAETSGKPATATTPFVVPGNLDISLNTKIGKLHYDKLDIQNLAGTVQVADETVKLNDVSGNALDGTIKINGSYSTKESKTKPAVAMSYDVAQVDIQKTFYAFNSSQKLMPIGKYIAGKLTSVLTANGKLGDGMSIDMNTISGNGNLFLIEGFLSKFAPLDKIATVLNVKQLEQISLKDVKTYFEFANGKLLVKPFTVKVKDIVMEIGGLQGFDESLNYAINLKLPRALMGTQGNQLINNLFASVNTKGIPLKPSDVVSLKLAMGGTIRNPTIKVDLKQTGETLADQMKEQVKDFAQAKIDSAKSAAKDTLNSIKKNLSDLAKEELRKKILGVKDTATIKDSTPVKNPQDKTKESIKGLFENLMKKKPKDTANKQ
jgi:hypothetical protein